MRDRTAQGRRGSLVDWLEARFQLAETFSFLTSFGIFPLELDTRLPLREALAEARKKPMPSYMRFPRVLGLLSVQLFFFLGLTGCLLAFYYRPTSAEAHASVTTIVRDVSFGWLVHQSHLWAARAFLAILLVRLLRLFFQGLYKEPREGLWMIGALLVLLAGLGDLTGRLLVYDAAGYWSTVRGVEVLEKLPGIGPAFVFLLGGTSFDTLVLTRAYVLHCAWIPLALLVLFHLNLTGLRRVGLSPGPAGEAAPRHPFRVYAYDLLILSVLVFGTLLTLATLLPKPFAVEADPFSTPPGAHPPWYLLAAHAALESLPAVVPGFARGLLVEAVLLLVLLLPFLDRGRWRPAAERRRAIALGTLALLAALLLSWTGYRLEVGR